jgi:hypothetical protein
MSEIRYLNYLVRVVAVETGWRVLIFKPIGEDEEYPIYQSNTVYATETEAIASGVQFIQRQQALSVLWQFLYECYCSGTINELELDNLSASMCLICSFKDFYSDYGYWYI